MIGRRATAGGIATKLGNPRSRETGTPAYLKNGGTLEKAAAEIAAGHYASRFAGAVAGAAHLAALRLRDKLARIAAAQLNLRPEDVRFACGRVFAERNPENWMSFARAAAVSHWSPGILPDDSATA